MRLAMYELFAPQLQQNLETGIAIGCMEELVGPLSIAYMAVTSVSTTHSFLMRPTRY